MLLPNGDRAIVDIRKLRDYCLNPDSPRGKGKARVFESTLGFKVADAERLREILLNAARTNEAQLSERDMYGQRYTIDTELHSIKGKAVVRSGWIIRHDETVPRLTTCYVLNKRPDEKK